jgi:hypothetical protein
MQSSYRHDRERNILDTPFVDPGQSLEPILIDHEGQQPPEAIARPPACTTNPAAVRVHGMPAPIARGLRAIKNRFAAVSRRPIT